MNPSVPLHFGELAQELYIKHSYMECRKETFEAEESWVEINEIPTTYILSCYVLPLSSALGQDILTTKPTVDANAISLLEIPRPRDEAIKEYGEWQALNVTDDTLKVAFR